MNIKIGDRVTVEFPSSALRIGGTVLGIVTVQGKEPVLEVVFSYGAHEQFPVSCVINHVSV